MTSTPTGQHLTRAQANTLGAAATAMIGIGALGAAGTYTNLTNRFPGTTALGAVAAGEGATLILALVYVGLTMLGQPAPAAVRIGLWALPAVASTTGAIAATSLTATAVYAVTPLAMCTAAEGAGLLARRIVVWTTGIDAEARRRTAAAVRALAYEQARAQRHPDKEVRDRAERRAWKLARHVGAGDHALGEQLVDVQRTRLTEGADAALATMFAPAVTPPVTAVTDERDAVTAPVTPALPAAPEPAAQAPAVTPAGTPITPPVPDPVTLIKTGADTLPEPAVTLADLAVVAGVTAPVPGESLTPAQLTVVLRHLRYADDPPLSYRQAVTAFRDGGYVGSEERVRRAWGALMSAEEDSTGPVT